MEYNFNYKLKFQVPQPSFVPPKSGARARCPSGAHAVHVWLTHSVRGARLASSRCASSSPVVCVWLAHGARAMRVWLARSLLT